MNDYCEQHESCAICWRSALTHHVELQLHHIAGRKSKRRNDHSNLLRLCRRCHMHHTHGGEVDERGKRLPEISHANVIWAKQQADGDSFDKQVLADIWGHAVPDAVEPDGFYLGERNQR